MNRAIRGGLALSLVAAACSDDGSAGESFRVDTRGGDALPALVAYDAGDGWLPAEAETPGVYAVPAAGEVAILVACDGETGASIALRYLTQTAPRARALPCPRGGIDGIPAAYPASIVPSTAIAFVGDFRLPLDVRAPQDALYAVPGRHDVIASSDTRVLVRRGVSFPPAEPLVIDVERDGSDLVPLVFDHPAVDADESLGGHYSLMTPSGARAGSTGRSATGCAGSPTTS